MKKAKTKTHRNAVKTLTYAYIRKIKKWMFCPACQNGKMTINKKSTLWICEDCGIYFPQMSLRTITYFGSVMSAIHISTIRTDLTGTPPATYAKDVDMKTIRPLIT